MAQRINASSSADTSSIVRVRIDRFVAVVMLGDLDCRAPAGTVRRRDAVMHAMPAFNNEHRELTRRR